MDDTLPDHIERSLEVSKSLRNSLHKDPLSPAFQPVLTLYQHDRAVMSAIPNMGWNPQTREQLWLEALSLICAEDTITSFSWTTDAYVRTATSIEELNLELPAEQDPTAKEALTVLFGQREVGGRWELASANAVYSYEPKGLVFHETQVLTSGESWTEDFLRLLEGNERWHDLSEQIKQYDLSPLAFHTYKVLKDGTYVVMVLDKDFEEWLNLERLRELKDKM